MDNIEIQVKNLIGKNEDLAQISAGYLINNADLNMFSLLVQKSDYLFDFVRTNITKRIKKAINKHNFLNIIKFFDIYSPYYDDMFVSVLSEHANQELTDEIFELLENGTIAQKTYAAKYFYYIPDTVAIELLSKYAFSDDEYLSFNSAQALGQMEDDISYDIALCSLESEDDFEKLKAVKFFSAYAEKFPLKEIFCAMKTSKMPENIAGQIPYAESLLHLLSSEYYYDTLVTIDYILSGLGEILPLADIFQFELYEVIDELIYRNLQENEYSGKIAQILLMTFSKFKEFNENQEYIFDEDKNTKNEISDIFKLLSNQSQEFWDKQKEFVLKELEASDESILFAIPVIKEFNLKSSIPLLKKLLNSQNEIIICEAACALKIINKDEPLDIDKICLSVKNENIKAIIENLR